MVKKKKMTGKALFELIKRLSPDEATDFARRLHEVCPDDPKSRWLNRFTQGAFITFSRAEVDRINTLWASAMRVQDSSRELQKNALFPALHELFEIKLKRRTPKKSDTPALMAEIKELKQRHTWSDVYGLLGEKARRRWDGSEIMRIAYMAFWRTRKKGV